MTNKVNNNENTAEINVNLELLIQQPLFLGKTCGTPVNDNRTSKVERWALIKFQSFVRRSQLNFGKSVHV